METTPTPWYKTPAVWGAIIVTGFVLWLGVIIGVIFVSPSMSLVLLWFTLVALGVAVVLLFVYAAWRAAYLAVKANKTGVDSKL